MKQAPVFSALRRALLSAFAGSAVGTPALAAAAPAVAAVIPVSTLALRSPVARRAAPFMAGFSFKPGDLPAGDHIVVDGAQAQATVKNRHDDGSVDFAVIAGQADLQAGMPTVLRIGRGRGAAPASAAPLTPADLQRTGLQLSIEAEGLGTALWSGDAWLRPLETWISGPRMSSWIYAQPAGSDAHLQMRLEVCLHAGGEVEVFPYVENGWLMVAGPAHKAARFIVKMDGRTCFDRRLGIGHHTRTPLIDGSMLGYWNTDEPRVAPKQSRAYLVASGKTVRPDPGVDYPRWTGAANTAFQPFQLGLFRNGMYGGAHYDGIGPQPGWEVAYLVSDDPLAYESMLRQAWSWGRYAIHYRDEKTGRPVAFSQHPTTQIAGQAQGSHHIGGLDTFHTLTYTPVPSGAMPAGDDYYAISHSPAPPYGAYRASGRHYLMEQCQFQATANFLSVGMSRNRTDGLCLYSHHQLRGIAWYLRTLFMAAVVTPDGHPLQREFRRAVKANVDFYWQRVVAQPNNPFGTIPQFGAGVALQTWQHDFLVGAWGLGLAARAAGDAATHQRMAQVFAYLAKGTIGRLGGTGPQEFLYVHQSGQQADPNGPGGSAPVMSPSPADVDPLKVDFERGTGPWCRHWGEVFRNAVGFDNPGVAGPLAFGDYPDPTGLWGQLHMALDECDRHGADGTAAALGRLRAASNFGELGAAIRTQRVLVCCRSTQATAAPARAVAAAAAVPASTWERFRSPPGEVHIINLNGLEDVDPERRQASGRWFNSYYNQNMIDSMTQSWSFGAAAKDHPEGFVQLWHGGGHGAAVAVTALQWKARTRRYGFIGWPGNVPEYSDWTGFRTLKANADRDHDPARDRRDPVWFDYDHQGSRIFLASHTYKMVAYCPPSPSVGPEGALIIGALQWGNDTNSPTGGNPLPVLRHHMNLATGVVQRGTRSPPVAMGAMENNAFCRDTRRNRLWHFKHGQLECWYEDLDEPVPRLLKPHRMRREEGAAALPAVRYIGLRYIEALDIILAQGGHANAATPMGFYMLDMASGFPVLMAQAPPPRRMPHGGYMAGFDYVPPLNAVYFYEGRQTTTMEVLQLSTRNVRSTGWQWRTERWTGATPPGLKRPPRMSDAEFNDVLYSPAERFNYDADSGMLIYAHGSTGPMRCVDGVMRQGGVAGFGLPGNVVAQA
ncbi:hypothetical protein [Aquincola tertiaricarbonis]|uniref:hypothetical protein n=1 Tax=Aquincola tertiaricarbonis TaxID=391953 RepID=UPI000614C383|nr:hypothetical protein [Aquincola tertiaricarbonis]